MELHTLYTAEQLRSLADNTFLEIVEISETEMYAAFSKTDGSVYTVPVTPQTDSLFVRTDTGEILNKNDSYVLINVAVPTIK